MFDLFRLKKPATGLSGPVSWIICGLGNPGRKYENTRHNAGFCVLDRLAETYRIRIDRLKFQGVCGDGYIGEQHVLLLKPQTFMNASGRSVREALAFYKLDASRLIVLCDDVSLPCGRIRVRAKGSDGGHNGLKDIIYQLGTDAFPRVRVGVGAKPRPDYELAAWVLSPLSPEEQAAIGQAFERAAIAAADIIAHGAAEAANRHNGS